MNIFRKLRILKHCLKKTCSHIVKKEDYNTNLKGLNATDKIEDIDYIKTLTWAINEKDITNIALSGPYGSGKSSILKAFEKELIYKNISNPDKFKFLNISLATFKEQETENTKKEDIIDQEVIEKSILQQMIYKEKANKIPNSRFKRINNITYLKWKTFFVTLWGLSVIELFSPFTFLYHFFPTMNYFPLLIIFSLGLIFIIYTFIKKTSSIKLQKLSLQAPEINLTENDSDISILNKHLDEIIYFFEVTGYNIVVIEDLDRFNNPEIFIKLRELNKLLNDSKQIDLEINFIYAIRDNMFLNKERTKFFEFFIPVIPIINFTNSFNKLKEMFIEAKLDEKMDHGFLREISLFIHDMRLLRNIFNEFLQYKERLEKNLDKYSSNENNNQEDYSLNLNNLFSMSIYKNYHPADFSLLHEKEGIVYNTFDSTSKHKRISLLVKKKREEIEELSKKIHVINEEKVDNIRLLRLSYIEHICKKAPTLLAFYDNGTKLTLNQALEDSNFKRIEEFTQFTYFYNYSGNNMSTQNLNVSFKDIENEVNSFFTYQERVNLIDEKLDNKENEYKELLQTKEREIKRIYELSIEELLEEFDEKQILDEGIFYDINIIEKEEKGEISKIENKIENRKEILVYLIRYGYINEMYRNYISYYYPGDETVDDINFLRLIKNRSQVEQYSLPLTKIEKILNDIRDNEYSIKAILNFDLLKFLIQKKDISENKERINKIIAQLRVTKNFKFIDEFIEIQENGIANSFIDILISQWNIFWKELIETDISENKKEKYFVLIIENTNTLLVKESLIAYLSEKDELQGIIDKCSDCNKLINFINKNNINFTSLKDYSYEKNKVFKEIYNKQRYAFTPYMLKVISEVKDDEKFNSQNYTAILETNKDLLIQCIHDNIVLYIEKVYMKLEKNTKDSEFYLSKLLNHKEITKELGVQILNKVEIVLSDIKKLPIYLWDTLFELKKIKPTIDNIYTYYDRDVNEEDDVPENFINVITDYLNDINGDLEGILEYNKDNRSGKLFREIIGSTNLSVSSLKNVLGHFNVSYPTADFLKTLELEKIKVLLNTDLIKVNSKNYDFLKERDDTNDVRIKLLERDPEINLHEFELHIEDIELILNSDVFIEDKKYMVLNEILNEELINNINDTKTIEVIYNILYRGMKYIPKEFCFRFIIQSSLSMKKKIVFFNEYKGFTRELIEETLTTFGSPYISLLQNSGKSNKIKNNKDDIYLLAKKLASLNYLSSVSELNVQRSTFMVYKYGNVRAITNS